MSDLRDQIIATAMRITELEDSIYRADRALPEFAMDPSSGKAKTLLNIRREAEDDLILARAALRGFCYGLRAFDDQRGGGHE